MPSALPSALPVDHKAPALPPALPVDHVASSLSRAPGAVIVTMLQRTYQALLFARSLLPLCSLLSLRSAVTVTAVASIELLCSLWVLSAF